MEKIDEKFNILYDEIAKVVIGRKKEIKLLLTALLSKGHVLLEDLPGMGKTTMAKAFSQTLHCAFSRIQCTPDLLPSDVTGTTIFQQKTGEFEFRKGPIFTNVLLVDEINRALPRTQSSFLESMEEYQVSVEGETYLLASPFFVLATQNPIDMEGTFPLPEAQLDRFLMKIQLGYPNEVEEIEMIEKIEDASTKQIGNVFHPDDIIRMQKECENVHIHQEVIHYIVSIARETRNHPLITVGVSPRASKSLVKAVKAWAYIQGRDYVLPDDVKDIILYVWGHRLRLQPEAEITGANQSEAILQQIVNDVAIPKEKVGRFNE